MIRTLLCRLQDAREIWEADCSQYPQIGPVTGWFGFRLRVKCTICILFDWEKRNDFGHVPVWVGPMYVNYANSNASWTEVGVGYGWRNWTYSRYSNGI